MDYQLTKHAQDALIKRRIPVEWLERALSAPLWSEKDQFDDRVEHFIIRIPEFGDKFLRVVVDTKVAPERIVTVFFDRRLKKP